MSRSRPSTSLVGCDCVADFRGGTGVGMPDAAGDEHLAGREMQIEAGRVNIPAYGMGKVCRQLRLVGALVGRKPGVTMDAEHRAAAGSRIGDIVAADSFQSRREGGDK